LAKASTDNAGENARLHYSSDLSSNVCMKTFLGGLAAVALLFGMTVGQALASDAVAITSAKKPTSSTKGAVGGGGSQAKDSETVVYDLTVQNQTLADLAGLKVDYLIFIERPKLGQPMTEPSRVERVSGTQSIDVLSNRAPQTVTTNPITLNKENLVGRWHYKNGGRIKAEDTVAGVWVRVTQNGQVVGEYANPSTIKSKGWDGK
jgi:hypothetical protein